MCKCEIDRIIGKSMPIVVAVSSNSTSPIVDRRRADIRRRQAELIDRLAKRQATIMRNLEQSEGADSEQDAEVVCGCIE
jgi:hypothetical protein